MLLFPEATAEGGVDSSLVAGRSGRKNWVPDREAGEQENFRFEISDSGFCFLAFAEMQFNIEDYFSNYKDEEQRDRRANGHCQDAA